MDRMASSAELAEILGVNSRTIQRLSQDGVLHPEADPEDKRRKVFPLAQSVQAYLKYQVERCSGKERAERIRALEEKKLEAEAGLKESQRDLHQLKTEIASGKYLSVEEVQLDYNRFFVVLKKFLLSIPSRVAGMVSGYLDPVASRALEKDIHGEIVRLLAGFVVAGCTDSAERPQRAAGKKKR